MISISNDSSKSLQLFFSKLKFVGMVGLCRKFTYYYLVPWQQMGRYADPGSRVVAHAPSTAGWTPLMYASYVGHDTVVNLLLDSGADACKGTPVGLTPLMVAAGCGNESVCYFLIQVSRLSASAPFPPPHHDLYCPSPFPSEWGGNRWHRFRRPNCPHLRYQTGPPDGCPTPART